MIHDIEEKIIGPCNNCNHHYEKTCLYSDLNAKWWNDAKGKTDRSTLMQMECFVEPDLTRALRLANDAAQRLLDHLKTKEQ